MDYQSEVAKAKELLDKAREVVILTHENPSADSIGSALALSLGLPSLGKTVTVACPDTITVELSNFVGANKVIQKISNKNFIISLDYIDGSIEKVSYNIEGDKFNLVIEHRSGFEPFSKDKVHYSYGGTNADLLITVGTIHLGVLGALYEENKELFSGKPVINIDCQHNNSKYGQVNLVNSASSSTAELVANLLADFGAELTADIASNLLNALYSATSNFQSPMVTARTFELASSLLRAGGKRFGQMADVTAPSLASFVPKPHPVRSHVRPHATVRKSQPPPMPHMGAAVTPIPATAQGAQPRTPIPAGRQPPSPQAGGSGQANWGDTSGQTPPEQAPEDWLKPKIFKSSTLL